MNLAKLSAEMNHVNVISSKLFDVITVPLYPPSIDAVKSTFEQLSDGVTFKRPNHYANYKHIGGEALGVIGGRFQATQPRDLFNSFTQCLIESDIDLSKMEYIELKGGSKIQFKVLVGGISFKNKAKKVDDVQTYLTLETGFDGLTKTTFSVETLRLICTNGMTVTDSKTSVSFKNTKGNASKILLSCNDISAMVTKADDYKLQIAAYNSKDVTAKDVEAFTKKVLGFSNAERSELKTRQTNNLDAFMEGLELEFSRTGATAWGLLNAATYYTNHVVSTKDRNDYLLAGGGKLFNTKAEKFVNELVLS